VVAGESECQARQTRLAIEAQELRERRHEWEAGRAELKGQLDAPAEGQLDAPAEGRLGEQAVQ